MSAYPQCSLAKIYTQMWSISMRDPLPKQYSNQQFSNNKFDAVQSHGNGISFGGNNTSSASGSRGVQGGSHTNKKKPNYCWTFNKGFCKDGSACCFVNRCSYCDAGDHGICICPKPKKAGVTIATPLQGPTSGRIDTK